MRFVKRRNHARFRKHFFRSKLSNYVKRVIKPLVRSRVRILVDSYNTPHKFNDQRGSFFYGDFNNNQYKYLNFDRGLSFFMSFLKINYFKSFASRGRKFFLRYLLFLRRIKSHSLKNIARLFKFTPIRLIIRNSSLFYKNLAGFSGGGDYQKHTFSPVFENRLISNFLPFLVSPSIKSLFKSSGRWMVKDYLWNILKIQQRVFKSDKSLVHIARSSKTFYFYK